MGKAKRWTQMSNNPNNWKQISVSNSNNRGKSMKTKSNNDWILTLKLLILFLVVAVAIILVLDWFGIIKLGIFPNREEEKGGN